jgi:hypothetical protein
VLTHHLGELTQPLIQLMTHARRQVGPLPPPEGPQPRLAVLTQQQLGDSGAHPDRAVRGGQRAVNHRLPHLGETKAKTGVKLKQSKANDSKRQQT